MFFSSSLRDLINLELLSQHIDVLVVDAMQWLSQRGLYDVCNNAFDALLGFGFAPTPKHYKLLIFALARSLFAFSSCSRTLLCFLISM